MNLSFVTIRNLAGILAGLKLNKISDSEVKTNLLMDFLAVRKASKGIEDDKVEFIKKFQEDWKDERVAVAKLQAEKKPIEGFDDYFKAVEEGNLVLQKMDETEIDVALKPVKMEKFVASVSEEEINFEQIAVLMDSGILEE